jgi:hypothetical protein
MHKSLRRIAVAALTSTMMMPLAAGPAAAQSADTYYFRLGNHTFGPVTPGTGVEPTKPDFDNDGTSDDVDPDDDNDDTPDVDDPAQFDPAIPPKQNPDTPPVTDPTKLTWGFCDGALVLTPYTEDCDGDDIPNMTPTPPGTTLTDQDPDDNWTPTYNEPDALEYNDNLGGAGQELLFGARGVPVYSNIVKYKGPDSTVYKYSSYGQYMICDAPAECSTTSDKWTVWSGAIKTGQYVRIRLQDGYTSTNDSVNAYIQIDGVYSDWIVSKKPDKDSDGDGLVDVLDPYPVDGNMPGPLTPHRYWRLQISDWYTEDYEVLDPTDPPYAFGEVAMCFANESCSNEEGDNIVYSTSQPDGDEYLNDGKWKDSYWEPGLPDDYQADDGHAWFMGPSGSVSFQVPSLTMPTYYSVFQSSIEAGSGWTYYATISLQYSADGSTWKTYETRQKAEVGYGGDTFTVGVPK